MLSPRIKKHFWYYVSFVILQVLGFWVILLTSFDRQMQFLAIFLVTGIYIFWSLIHQHVHHTLHPKIVMEYVFVGGVGIAISLLLFR